MNREEHLQWCKERALAYAASYDAKNAVASMLSDLDKHPETKGHKGGEIGMMFLFIGKFADNRELVNWINGFN